MPCKRVSKEMKIINVMNTLVFKDHISTEFQTEKLCKCAENFED